MAANELIIKINGDAKDFIDAVKDSKKEVSSLNTVFTEVTKYSAVAFASMTASAALMLKAFGESEKVFNQTKAALVSTGRSAEVSAESLSALANSLSEVTTFDDENILRGINTIIRFKNIATENIEAVTKVSIDMAAALGTDVASAAQSVGKALADPIQGLATLSRSGVKFTDEQEQLIKALVETGNAATAQAKILDELNRQFGGQAEAVAKGTGAFTQLKNEIENLAEELGKNLAPAAIDVTKTITELLRELRKNEGLTALTADFLKFGIALTGVATALGVVGKTWATLQPVLAAIGGLVGLTAGATALAGTAAIGVGAVAVAGGQRGIVAQGSQVGGEAEFQAALDSYYEKQIEIEKEKTNVSMEFLDFQKQLIDDLMAPQEEVSPIGVGTSLKQYQEEIATYEAEQLISVKKQIEALKQEKESRYDILDDMDEIMSVYAEEEDAIFQQMEAEQLLLKVRKDEIAFYKANPLQGILKGLQGDLSEAGAFGTVGGIGQAAGRGQEGARELVVSGAKLAADAILPGLGEAVGPFLEIFSQGPEVTRQMLEGFIDGIPIIIQNIVESIPVLIDVLAKKLPFLIVELTRMLSSPSFQYQLIMSFAEALVEGVPYFINALIDEIKGAFSGGILGGGGGGGAWYDPTSWFAEGGQIMAQRVPEGFDGDKYPAMLSSGELIIDRSASKGVSDMFANGKLENELKAIKDGISTDRNLTINLMVGESELAQVLLNLNRQGFRTA